MTSISQHPLHHESEWIYSSVLSRRFLTPMNDCIHHKLCLSPSSWWWWRRLCYPLFELYIAMCGYAFNPVMFPIWPLLIYTLSINRHGSLTNASSPLNESIRNNNFDWKKRNSFDPLLDNRHPAAVGNTALYLTSVALTLAFTELGKALFSTSRPTPPPSKEGHWTLPRKYETIVASLKSKHSFPSGDCAQAMNFCMIVCKYVTDTTIATTSMPVSSEGSILHGTKHLNHTYVISTLLFGIFLPSVAFARVYFRCHWIEDCIGGIALSFILHMTIIPEVAKQIARDYLYSFNGPIQIQM